MQRYALVFEQLSTEAIYQSALTWKASEGGRECYAVAQPAEIPVIKIKWNRLSGNIYFGLSHPVIGVLLLISRNIQ